MNRRRNGRRVRPPGSTSMHHDRFFSADELHFGPVVWRPCHTWGSGTEQVDGHLCFDGAPFAGLDVWAADSVLGDWTDDHPHRPLVDTYLSAARTAWLFGTVFCAPAEPVFGAPTLIVPGPLACVREAVTRYNP